MIILATFLDSDSANKYFLCLAFFITSHEGQFNTKAQIEESETYSSTPIYPVTPWPLDSLYELSDVMLGQYWCPLFPPLGVIHYIFRTPLS
jgi:hypothetical protein